MDAIVKNLKTDKNDPRVEIRITTKGRIIKEKDSFCSTTHGSANVLLTVRYNEGKVLSPMVTFSSNGKAEFSGQEFHDLLAVLHQI